MTMNSWQTQLKGDSLAWLLEPDEANPGVRYFAWRDLLDRPEDDPEVAQAGQVIMTSGPVPVILKAQHPDGYWAEPGAGYWPSYRSTAWQIILLAKLGANPRDERVQRGCEYFLSHAIAANGGFSMSQPPIPSKVVHCHNGDSLEALVSLGYADDPRVQAAVEWQTRAIIGQGEVRYYKSGTSGPRFALCCFHSRFAEPLPFHPRLYFGLHSPRCKVW